MLDIAEERTVRYCSGAVLCVLVLFALPLGAAFNFGVSPTQVDEGVQMPGDRFYVSFFVTSSEEDVAIGLETQNGTVETFERLRSGQQDRFSEQPCIDCVEFLNGAGALDAEAEDNDNVDRYKAVEFFVDVPEDAEPGHHLLSVTPQPRQTGGGGGVGVVSTASVPVMYEVPGDVVRSLKLLGVQTGDNVNDRQKLSTMVYNNGTVTVEADVVFMISADGENTTARGGGITVAPGETETVHHTMDMEDLGLQPNESFTARATADYTTGRAETADVLRVKQPTAAVAQAGTGTTPEQEGSLLWYLLVVAVLSATSMVTWWVIRREI